jgi:hypothetical protein
MRISILAASHNSSLAKENATKLLPTKLLKIVAYPLLSISNPTFFWVQMFCIVAKKLIIINWIIIIIIFGGVSLKKIPKNLETFETIKLKIKTLL